MSTANGLQFIYLYDTNRVMLYNILTSRTSNRHQSRLRADGCARGFSKWGAIAAVAGASVAAAAAIQLWSGSASRKSAVNPLVSDQLGSSGNSRAASGQDMVNAGASGVAVRDIQLVVSEQSLVDGLRIEVADLGIGEDCLLQLHVKNEARTPLRATLARSSCACADFQAPRDLPADAEDTWSIRIRRAAMTPTTTAGIQIPHGKDGAVLLALRVSEKISRRLFAWTVADDTSKAVSDGTDLRVRICALAASDSDVEPLPIGWSESSKVATPIRFSSIRLVRSGEECGDWIWYFESEMSHTWSAPYRPFVVGAEGWRAVRVGAPMPAIDSLLEAVEPQKTR
jgi:hypothetical protein